MKEIKVVACLDCIFFNLVNMSVNKEYSASAVEYEGFCNLRDKINEFDLSNRFLFYDSNYILEDCPLKDTNFLIRLVENK